MTPLVYVRRMRILLAVLLASLFVPTIHADILIYKGTCTEYEVTADSLPVTKKVFVIVEVPPDLTQSSKAQIALVIYGRENDVKRYTSSSSAARATLLTRPDLKFVGAFSSVNALDNPNETVFFQHGALFFRGVQKPLTVEVNGNSTRIANHPNSMKGTGSISAIGLSSAYIQRTFLVTFDQTKTVQANVADQSLPAAVTTIENHVKSLGFNP